MAEKEANSQTLAVMRNAKLVMKKRETSHSIERGNPFDILPVDVVNEILLRLSAAEIVQIRHVCKKFAQFTRHPSFVSLHMKRYNTDPSTCLIMYVNICPNFNMVEGFSKLPILGKAKIMMDLHASQLDHYQCPNTILKTPEIFGHCLEYLEAACDGLLCFRKKVVHDFGVSHERIASFVIGNPVTREWMSASVPIQQNHLVTVFGFYFHAPSGKYKLLLQFRSCFTYKPGLSYAVGELVPNLLTPIDYSIPCHPLISHSNRHGPVLLHGKLHWFGHEGENMVFSGSRLLINQLVVFNIENEQFSQIPIPSGFSMLFGIRLFEFEGKLCLFKTTDWPDVVVWVLEDYEKGIWIEKRAVIRSGLCDIQEQAYKFVVDMKSHLLLLKPGFCDTEFTFYSIKIPDLNDFLFPSNNASIVFAQKYSETLASFGMQQQMLTA